MDEQEEARLRAEYEAGVAAFEKKWRRDRMTEVSAAELALADARRRSLQPAPVLDFNEWLAAGAPSTPPEERPSGQLASAPPMPPGYSRTFW